MKLEEVAAMLFLLCMIVLVVSIYSIRLWDAVVRPIVELTGALVYTLRYPALFAGLLFGLYVVGRRLRHR